MNRKDFLKYITAISMTTSGITLNKLETLAKTLDLTPKMPVLFIGHGNPMNALLDNPFTQSLKATGEAILSNYRPKAILVVSAHWLTNGSFVCINPKPRTIHDFGGFPPELYKLEYPALGSTDYAREAAKLNSIIKEDEKWGLDHGAWTILMHLFPNPTIPTFQLSIDYYKPMQYHYDLAISLKELRNRGFLIIGSGNIVHNLQIEPKETPYDWNIEFDSWVKENIDNRNFNNLINYETAGKSAELSVPTIDHYAPLLYSLAFADKRDEIKYTYEGYDLGMVSMRCFRIG